MGRSRLVKHWTYCMSVFISNILQWRTKKTTGSCLIIYTQRVGSICLCGTACIPTMAHLTALFLQRTGPSLWWSQGSLWAIKWLTFTKDATSSLELVEMSLYSFALTLSPWPGAESTHQCLLERSIDPSPSQHVLRGGRREGRERYA